MTTYTFLAPDGARCRICENGGHIASWVPAGGQEQFFLSPLSSFDPGASIRGGVPVIFPQFNAWGPYARHGFARRQPWTFLGEETGEDGRMRVRFELRESAATLAEWPFAFRCVLTAVLGGRELVVGLRIENRGEQAFSFSAALHSYFSVENIAGASLSGLRGARYQDWAEGSDRAERVQLEDELGFDGEVDRIFFGSPRQVALREGRRRLVIAQEGFSDTVVWNPGSEKGQALSDLEPGGWRKFVCVEAALIYPPVTLMPGGDWSGSQVLHA